MQHLLDQGRRLIGLITGPLDWWSARERQAGWHATLEQGGVEPAPSLVVEGNWTVASGERGIHRLLAHRPDIDADFAANDQMALGVLRAAHLLGRRVPDDLAVVGFDNIPEAAYFGPSLTTVRQHLIELGRIAVQELQNAIEARRLGTEDPQTVVRRLSPELIVRESSVASVGSTQSMGYRLHPPSTSNTDPVI